MVRRKTAALGAPFQGPWRLAEMDVWDDAAIDLLGPASLEIQGDHGEMRFVAVTAALDVRYDTRSGAPIAEFSWQGTDDGEPSCGRGWLVPGTAGRLVGHIFFHYGDDSGFVCEPW